jgi:hypothetical protein
MAREEIIVSIDDNHYYKFIDAIGSGVYFHQMQNIYPKLANPMSAPNARNTELLEDFRTDRLYLIKCFLVHTALVAGILCSTNSQ